MVNIAGKRASLGDLNRKLNEIPGVKDGVFHLPVDSGRRVERLMAFVVAPGRSEAELLEALRLAVDPAFLPRPLVKVDALPRTESGKLPLDRIRDLEAAWRAS
jgi:acyl-coenzyme A synthetase/AMP-(fatty) acid ligase